MNLPPPTSRVSLREYHSTESRWSSSRLKCFRSDPALAFGQFVAHPRLYSQGPPSGAQVIGSAVHDIVAKKGGAESSIYRAEVNTRRSATEYNRALDAFPDKLVLTRAEHDEAKLVASQILEPRTPAAKLVKALLTGPVGHSEWYHAWEDESGVPCQQLVDRLTVIYGRPVVFELKTAIDPRPRPFFYQARNLGYDDQMAFNLRGAKAALSEEPLGLFGVVGTKPSYPVCIYSAGEEMLRGTKGRRGRASAQLELDVTLERLAECLEDETGAAWHLPGETLDGDRIPELGELP